MKRLTTVLLTVVSMISYAANNDSFNNQQVDNIEKIVHEYLIKNPEVLLEASTVLRQKQAEEQQRQMQSSIEQNKMAIFSDEKTPSFGPQKPQAYVVEFYDFQCGHCKSQSKVMDELIKKHKDIKLVLKDFPIFGERSIYTAKATMSAYKINKKSYLHFHDLLMTNKKGLDKKTVLSLAKKAGYNQSSIEKMINSTSINEQMKNEMELAKKLNIQFTPFIIVANADLSKIETVPGAAQLEQLEKVISSVK